MVKFHDETDILEYIENDFPNHQEIFKRNLEYLSIIQRRI